MVRIERIRDLIRDVGRLPELRARSERLEQIEAFARCQSREMDDDDNDGRNARPPEGEDWNALASQCSAFD